MPNLVGVGSRAVVSKPKNGNGFPKPNFEPLPNPAIEDPQYSTVLE
jgi:hypothetical protein